ncbi:hypothetical protein [Rhodopseudomonas palustris]
MKRIRTTYLSSDELHKVAAEKLQEAAVLPEGPPRHEMLRAAQTLSNLADMKRWLSSKELQPPRLATETSPSLRRRRG